MEYGGATCTGWCVVGGVEHSYDAGIVGWVRAEATGERAQSERELRRPESVSFRLLGCGAVDVVHCTVYSAVVRIEDRWPPKVLALHHAASKSIEGSTELHLHTATSASSHLPLPAV